MLRLQQNENIAIDEVHQLGHQGGHAHPAQSRNNAVHRGAEAEKKKAADRPEGSGKEQDSGALAFGGDAQVARAEGYIQETRGSGRKAKRHSHGAKQQKGRRQSQQRQIIAQGHPAPSHRNRRHAQRHKQRHRQRICRHAQQAAH
ncbi:hypothetical protein SDC9_156890 [bioreactor metagenome]|uniref:Uncharacterized protein n=1 Tax=bioreactor metagenome TaxID=1076179 RepID=A0A645F8E1_9ZZZZ